jgi:prepilin-type N-terminal cleavage/methylation domain-containing protein
MSTLLWSAATCRRFCGARGVGGLYGGSPGDHRALGLGRRESGDKSPHSKRAFTLVELLVVVVVIGILAGMVLGALQAARETARIAKTRATIAKLHNVIMGMYESYRVRRVPINTANMAPKAAALARLYALRDLMRLEMPERMTDISKNPIFVPNRPALSQGYVNHLNGKTLASNAPAECLYMIVTIACRAREKFSENEIGDTDGNGFPEFVDGWGHPIFFLRWAPGFMDSDIQWNYVAGGQSAAATTDHDPFDPMGVDPNANNWRLVPLIYSAGPDGKYGIAEDTSPPATPYTWNNDTYTQIWGSPDATTCRLDNLHNHRVQGNSK